MHELGVVMEVVRTVEEFAKANGVTKIEAVVLQLGELSSMIPQYIQDCYPAAADGTILEGAELRIEILPGTVRCKDCGKVFSLIKSEMKCPQCGAASWEILTGREFLIKEIVAY